MRGRWMAAVLLGACVLLFADSRVRIVRISYLAHGVLVRKPGANGKLGRWSAALLNAPVIEAEQFRTGPRGKAEIELECGSALRLAPESHLTVARLRLRDNGVRRTTVVLNAGEAYFTLRSADAADFHARFAGGVVSTPHGAATLRLKLPPGRPPTIELLAGHALFTWAARDYPLRKNTRWSLAPGGGLRRVANTRPGKFQRWSHNRDQRFERELMAAAPSTGVDAASSAPPVPGAPPVSEPDMILDPEGGFTSLDAALPDPLLSSAREVRKVPYCAGN